jgi:hypothetical protein
MKRGKKECEPMEERNNLAFEHIAIEKIAKEGAGARERRRDQIALLYRYATFLTHSTNFRARAHLPNFIFSRLSV